MISVVVPVGRVDRQLEEQLDALAAQTISAPFEVVLSLNTDDAEARDAAEALLARPGREGWRVVPALDGRGPSYARNAGARAARGDVLAFCDADDVVDPGWLEHLVAGLEELDVAGGHIEGFGASAAETAARPPATPGALPTYMGVPYVMSCNLAIRRSTFEAHGGFDEGLRTCEDMALSWSVLVGGGRIGYVPEARIAYRYRAGWKALVTQHLHYGRGLSQVMLRYGVPDGTAWARPQGRLLKANGQPGAARSLRNTVRRSSIAAGRLWGLAGQLAPRGRR